MVRSAETGAKEAQPQPDVADPAVQEATAATAAQAATDSTGSAQTVRTAATPQVVVWVVSVETRHLVSPAQEAPAETRAWPAREAPVALVETRALAATAVTAEVAVPAEAHLREASTATVEAVAMHQQVASAATAATATR